MGIGKKCMGKLDWIKKQNLRSLILYYICQVIFVQNRKLLVFFVIIHPLHKHVNEEIKSFKIKIVNFQVY